MNFNEATEVVEGLRSKLTKMDVRVVQEDNPTFASQLLRHFKRQSGGEAAINSWLDPDLVLRTTSDFFLITFWHHGDIVAKMSARIDNVGHEESFYSFALRGLKTGFREQNGEPSYGRFPEETKNMHGRVSYVGDLFVARSFRGARSKHKLTPLMLAWLYVTIGQRWGVPDYTVACIRPRDSIGQDWRSLWNWIEGAGGFTKPAESAYRDFWLGVVSRELFKSHLDNARDLAGIEPQASLAMPGRSTGEMGPTSSSQRGKRQNI